MPAIKFRPSRGSQKRDFWGDARQGLKFALLIDMKFGRHFGSRREAIAFLGLQRRLFNMYITGERSIPDEIWDVLKKMPDYFPGRILSRWDEDIDPLS